MTITLYYIIIYLDFPKKVLAMHARHTHTHTHTHTRIHTYKHTHTHTQIHTPRHTHLYLYSHLHSHTHTHTHTHTLISRRNEQTVAFLQANTPCYYHANMTLTPC
jgi:hypothetical protein